MLSKILKYSILWGSLVLFISCLTLEADLTLKSNGSGKAIFRYNMSTLAMDIRKTDGEKKILPFPVTIDEFEQSAVSTGGISILDYKLTTDGSRYYISSEIEFSSLEQLSLFTGIQFQTEKSGTNTEMTIVVFEPSVNSPVSEKTLNLVREKFPEEYCSFQITIPGDIIRVERATFSGSDVSFKVNVADLLSSADSIGFSVEYR